MIHASVKRGCLFAVCLAFVCRLGVAAGLDWNAAAPGKLPPGWLAGGKGSCTVLPSFGGETHPVVELKSTGDGFVLYNYNLAPSYGPDTQVRFKFMLGDRCAGGIGFANHGSGSRGGCGLYVMASGALEVSDSRNFHTTLLKECRTGTWYEVSAYLSTVEETWDIQVRNPATGESASLRSLPWYDDGVRTEKSYAGIAYSVYSTGTVYVSEAEIGVAPEAVRTKRRPSFPLVSLPHLDKPPTIDGRLESGEWDHAAHIGSLCTLNTGRLAPNPCDLYLGCDATNLYLAFHQPLRSSRDVQAAYTKRDDNVWMDDCFEFLIEPSGKRDARQRLHFVGNAVGAIWDDKGGDKSWNANWNYRVSLTETAWDGEISVPFADLGATPKEGDEWAFNVGRTLSSHDALLTTSYSVWAMPSQTALGFLDTATYGLIQFRGSRPWVSLGRMAAQAGNRFTASLVAENPGGQPAECAVRVEDNSAILDSLLEKKVSVPAHGSQRIELDTDFPNRWRVVAAIDNTTVLRQEAANPMANQPSLSVRAYPLQNVLEVELDLSHLRRATGAAFQAQLTVFSADRRKEWLTESLGEVTGSALKRLPIDKLPQGDYLAQVRVLDGKGQPVIDVERKFLRGDPRPRWFTDRAGIEDRLLDPFTAVTVKDRNRGRTVNVWGRAHDFGNGGLPRQILSRDTASPRLESLLSGPMRLMIRQSGKEFALEFQRSKRLESKPTRASWESEATLADGARATLTTTIEFDGMIRLDLRLAAGATIEGLEFEAPLRSVTHYYTSFLDQYSSEAGRLPKEGFHTAFRPEAWAGDMDRGLFWFTESDRDWVPADFSRGIEIVPIGHGAAAALRVHWLGGRAVTLKTDRTYTFGLQATPVKPLPRGHQNWRYGEDFKFLWWCYFNDALTQPMVHGADIHEMLKAEHGRGCAVLPYFFPTGMKAFTRDCDAYKNEWGHPSDLADLSDGGLMPPPMYMRMDTSWADYFLAGLDEFARDFAIDGVYYDTTGPFRQVRTSEDGERYTYWPLFAVREFHRRTAVIFEKRRGPGHYVLMYHMSDNMDLPGISTQTVAFDGEQYNRLSPNSTDYTAFLPLERAEVIDNPEHWGFPVMFLPEIPVRKGVEQRKTARLATDSLLAMLLPLGNTWWNGPLDYARQKRVTDALDAFGARDAVFHPYWRQKEILAPEGILVTYYERHGRRLAIVSNPGPQDRVVALSVARARPCSDALDGSAVDISRLAVPGRNFRILRWE